MSDLLQGLNIYLIGMMGSGKTTVGKYLAENLRYRFIDIDQTIEAIAKQPIPAIFEQSGEASFRELETQVLGELSVYTRTVIATGGGIVQEQMNWSYLRHGLVVWLDVDLETLKKRVAEDQNRPLADKLESLLTTRLPFYAQADLKVSPQLDQSPQAVAAQIEELIPSVLKSQTQLDN
ncbi:MAG: shikimate kinase [Waterburya sp.]